MLIVTIRDASHLVMMERPIFEFEVRDLLCLPQAAYEDVGIIENPFHFFSSGESSTFKCREGLLKRILKMSKREPFPYLTGHMLGGSGKTYLLSKTFENYAASEEVAVVKLTDIVGYRFPLPAVNLIGKQVLQYLKGASGVKRIVILDEVEFPELYELCFQFSDHIIAGGHYLKRDSGELKDKFQEIDIDTQWPISQEDIYSHLSHLLKLSRGDAIIDSALVELVAMNTDTIGLAELVLGLLLATYVHRNMVGRCPTITTDDVRFWLSVIGTNWFWFSMDCWRIKDPVTTTILYSYCGQRSSLTLDININARIRSILEK